MRNFDVSTIKLQGGSKFSFTPFYFAYNLTIMSIVRNVLDDLSIVLLKKLNADDSGVVKAWYRKDQG